MVQLNNDPVATNAFTEQKAFESFYLAFRKRQQEDSYIIYGGPYIKWRHDTIVDDYMLAYLLQYLHDLGCAKVTLAVFEPRGTSVKLPIGLSIGYPASRAGHNWIHKGFEVTDDDTISRDYTVYKYVLEGVYG
jgi:hypothetical protein